MHFLPSVTKLNNQQMMALRLCFNFQIKSETKFYLILVYNLRIRNLARLLVGSLLTNQFWLLKLKQSNSKSLLKKQKSKLEQLWNLKRNQLLVLSGLRYLNQMSTVSLMKQGCQLIITRTRSYQKQSATNSRRIKSNSSKYMRSGYQSNQSKNRSND